MLNILIGLAFELIFKIINAQFTCEIILSDRTDCAADIASQTGTLAEQCEARGCCFEEREAGSKVPWCYNKIYNFNLDNIINLWYNPPVLKKR